MINYFRQLWEYLMKPCHFNELLAFVTVIMALIGGIFAFIKWSDAVRTKRIEMLENIVRQLRFNKRLSDTFGLIDYGWLTYDGVFHSAKVQKGHDLDFEVNRLLSYLSFICHLKRERNISEKEFSAVSYEINRICHSKVIRLYLWNLYHFSEAQGSLCSFNYLVDYMLHDCNSNIDIKEFKKRDSEQYEKYLDFS